MHCEMSAPVRRHLSYLMTGMRAGWSIRQILLAAAPIAIAVFVFGASFGVLAVAAHLPAWSVVLMSALVFAGSAQFAALGVIAAGGSVLAAIFAGALLNLRFFPRADSCGRCWPSYRSMRVMPCRFAPAHRAGPTGGP